MGIKISHSAVRTYTQCPKKYKLHYLQRLRSKVTSGALLFGTAIDTALNHLLKTRNLEESINLFELAWENQPINKVNTYLPTSTIVTYAAKDFDHELLTAEDIERYKTFKASLGLDNTSDLKNDVKYILEKKAEQGFEALEDVEKQLYSLSHWLCLRQKGLIILKSYTEKILPKIKQVLSIQENLSLENNEGDEITMYLDMIVELQDGSRWLLDNKTTSMEYEPDSPMKSQQLIIYYHRTKDKYNLDGVGFIPIYKQMLKNRVKICSACKFDGSGSRHKTCNNEINGSRCGSPWSETISPEARIEMLLNRVPEAAEDLVIETFDEAVQGIKKEAFGPNLGACGSPNTGWVCPYYAKCWKGKDDDLVKV